MDPGTTTRICSRLVDIYRILLIPDIYLEKRRGSETKLIVEKYLGFKNHRFKKTQMLSKKIVSNNRKLEQKKRTNLFHFFVPTFG